jgi:hypothetical protein
MLRVYCEFFRMASHEIWHGRYVSIIRLVYVTNSAGLPVRSRDTLMEDTTARQHWREKSVLVLKYILL